MLSPPPLVLLLRSAPSDPSDWDPSLAPRLSTRIAQLAATNASDISFKSPWAVELAERAPDVSGGANFPFGGHG
jgi:hypothetical protein